MNNPIPAAPISEAEGRLSLGSVYASRIDKGRRQITLSGHPAQAEDWPAAAPEPIQEGELSCPPA